MKAKKQSTTAFSIYGGDGEKVIDFNEFRLSRLIEQERNEVKRGAMRSVRKRYVLGDIALAWDEGVPVFVDARHQ